MITARYDPLCDEGRAYADRLEGAGVDVVHVHYDAMMHGFFSLGAFLDDAQAALTAAGEAVAAALA